MTDTPSAERARENLPVTQADRDAAADCSVALDMDAVTFLSGACDTLVQAFAQHRIASQSDAAPTAAAGEGVGAVDALIAAWHGGWSYDFGPHNVPSGLIEVAFDAGLGYSHVRICERVITRSMASYDRPLPLDQYEYGYRDEGGKEVSDGRPPYAWRKIALPPHPRPFSGDQPRDVETYIHNHCPDKVRDHVATLTARAALATPQPESGEGVTQRQRDNLDAALQYREGSRETVPDRASPPADVAGVVEALRPFAELGDCFVGDEADDLDLYAPPLHEHQMRVRVGWLRAARDAYAALDRLTASPTESAENAG